MLEEPGDYCDRLKGKPKHRTIVIVLSNMTELPILLLYKIVSFGGLLKDKQASSVISEEIVPPDPLVQENETCLFRRQLSLPVAYLLHNRIVTESLYKGKRCCMNLCQIRDQLQFE